MSSILIDDGNLATPQVQPGSRLRYNQDGTISGSSTYNTQYALALSNLPGLGSTSPLDSRAFASDREVMLEEATAAYVLTYSGVWSSAVQKVEGIASSQQVPIDQNPNFYSTLANASPVFPPTTTAGEGALFAQDASGNPTSFIAFIPGATDADHNEIGGLQSYYGPAGTTVRINYSATNGTTVTSAIANIGTVSSSLAAGSITLSGTNFILCTSVNWEEIYMISNSVFRITEEYLYNPDGWNPNVYA